MSRLILVGEAPSRSGDPNNALGYACFTKLRCQRLNVFDSWQGSNGKGSAFPLGEARKISDVLKQDFARSRVTVVLVGKRVAQAFGINNPRYFAWYGFGFAQFAVFPHPSKVNKFWNEPKNHLLAAKFIARLWE